MFVSIFSARKCAKFIKYFHLNKNCLKTRYFTFEEKSKLYHYHTFIKKKIKFKTLTPKKKKYFYVLDHTNIYYINLISTDMRFIYLLLNVSGSV